MHSTSGSLPSILVTVIGELAFGDCRMLTKVNLSEGLKVLEGSTFYNCSSLQEISIPSSVTVMGPGIFENCIRLFRVKLPEGLTAIEYFTFLYCKSLQEVPIPSTVKRIGKMAFQNCESLRDVTFKLGLRRIEEGAFAECQALRAISIPPTVDSIEYRAFQNCHEMVAVQFQKGTNAKLRTASFRGLHSLINISLPNSMSPVKIVKGAFEDCTWLEDEFYHGSPSQHVPGRVDMREHERVVEGLCSRYRNHLPLHDMCYDPPPATTEEELRALNAKVEESNMSRECARVDCFGLNPFHILTSSANLRRDVLELLLSSLDPVTAYKCCLQKDRRGNSCIDYLLAHPCRRWQGQQSAPMMIQIILQKTVSCRLLKWGLKAWHTKMSDLVDSISSDLDVKKRAHLVDKVYQYLAICERHEKASLLELALWNKEIRTIIRKDKFSHQPAADRLAFRIRCGADVVIPHVTSFW